ncbi:hypothetical protein DV736_g3942, partial [Chaetothyriales sp. CBS 134916]
MGFWPFGSSRKNRRNSTTADAPTGSTLAKKNTPSTMARRPPAAATRQTSRHADNKSRKLSKPRTAAHQAVGLQHPRPHATSRDTDKTTVSPSDPSQPTSNLYLQDPMSQFSIGPEDFTSTPHPPTLHAKRPDHDPTVRRTKSGKRKADDYTRQKEIQAMSASMSMPRPKRPATYSGSGPLIRDTTTIPGNMNRRLARPASQISLPRQEDIAGQDAMPASFRIGVLSALSPRPTIKYESRRLSAAGKQPAHRMSADRVIHEEDVAHSKTRIDELADDLDSSGIRELLERDRRHREKRKEADRARLHRRLQRRADRQREEETRRKRVEEFASQSSAHLHLDLVPPHTEDEAASGQVVGHVDAGHGLRERPDSTNFPGQDPFTDLENVRSTNIRNPFEDEQDMDIMQEPSDQDDEQGPPIAVKSPVRKAHARQTWEDAKPSQATLSPPTSPIEAPADTYSVSQTSGMARRVTPDVVESTDHDLRLPGRSSHNISSWTSFFKIRGRRKPNVVDKGRTTPSEFSNTSRESFARKQPPPIVPPGRTFRRSDSAMPQRTLSKFREDLPEFPISPPDSRVHSPEAAGSHLSSKHVRQSLSGTLDDKSLATSSSNPTLDRQRPDSRLQMVPATEADSANPEPSQRLLSRSLASVDSEGSWLSGKPVKRSSGHASLSWRHSGASLGHHLPVEIEQEEDDLAKDEYLCRLSPAPQERRESVAAERKASSTIIDFQNERGQASAPEVALVQDRTDEQWHQGVARQPTVVRHTEAARSREGLLKEYEEDENESSDIDDDSPHPEETVQLMRARSVEYKGDVRRVSAGSARLLDIRRSSTVSTPRNSGFHRPVELGEHKSASTPKL